MSGWLVNLLVLLGVLAIVVVAGWFVLGQMNLTEPVRKIVLIVFVIVVAVIACIILLSLPGGRLTRGESQFLAIGAAMPSTPSIVRENC
jgi:type VI protein secretion system component VasK